MVLPVLLAAFADITLLAGSNVRTVTVRVVEVAGVTSNYTSAWRQNNANFPMTAGLRYKQATQRFYPGATPVSIQIFIEAIVNSASGATAQAKFKVHSATVGKVRTLRQTTGVPTIAAGAGAGTGPTISISGNGQGGIINLTTGTTTTTAATLFTLTYSTSMPLGASIALHPANAATAALAVGATPFATSTATVGTVTSNSTALAASTAYAWHYTITGY